MVTGGFIFNIHVFPPNVVLKWDFCVMREDAKKKFNMKRNKGFGEEIKKFSIKNKKKKVYLSI